MGDRPFVSVLLPVFNGERFLDACIASLHRQTLPEFEIVAVDDGSSDSTGEILQTWRERDRRIRVVRTPRNGLVAALNTGLERCRGDLIARMDADDLALPERLELQRKAMCESPEIDVLGCRVRHFSSIGVGQGFRVYEHWLNRLTDDHEIKRELYVESPMPHPSVMLRKRLLVDNGGYRDLGWPEDYDLWLRLAATGATFAKLKKTLLRWRDHTSRLTRTDRRYAIERFLECKAHHLASGPLRARQRVIIWGAGQTGRRLAKHLLRNRVAIEAFVDIDPKKCGRTLRGRAIITVEALEPLRKTGEHPIVLAAVSSRGARAKIRRHLRRAGWREMQDFWCVA